MISTPILERSPPHSLEAEQGVLGSILLLPEVLDDVALVVKAEDFHSTENAKLFRHLSAMYEAGKRIDLTLLVNRLKKAGDLESIGGISYLTQVFESCPTAHNATHYAKIVRDDAAKRDVIRCATKMLQSAHERDVDAPTLLAESEAALFAVGERRVVIDAQPWASILETAMAEVDERRRSKTPPGILSGYQDLDAMTAGFRRAQFIIIAGRPHMGKTALASCIAEHMLAAGKKLLFVSLEMNSSELAERMLAQRSRVPLMSMLEGTTTPDDRRRLIEAQSELSVMPLVLTDAPTRSIAEIASVCRREKRRNGLDVVFVDYLTQIEPDNTREPRQEQVAKLSRRLKSLARELGVPVVCVAQLNRDIEKSGGTVRAPRLSDLRESGAIEQDADVVLMVHRPEIYIDKDNEKAAVSGKAELYVRKVRNGKTGVVNLVFIQEYGRFESAANEHSYATRPARSYDASSPRGKDFNPDDPIT